jgi:hypothetical protein
MWVQPITGLRTLLALQRCGQHAACIDTIGLDVLPLDLIQYTSNRRVRHESISITGRANSAGYSNTI